MIAWLSSLSHWWVSGWIGIILYWLPAVINMIVYLYRMGVGVKKDYIDRSNSYCYSPEITVGLVLGHFFLVFCPVVNLICCVSDTAWKITSFIGKKLEWILEVPFVPDSDKYRKIRNNNKE